MFAGFSHVAIGVFDLEESVRFYTEIVGMDIDYRARHRGPEISRVVGVEDAELEICVLRKGDFRVELIEYPDRGKKLAGYKDQATPGLIHLAFKVNDVDVVYHELERRGYRFHSAPTVTRDNGPKICYFFGPDNVTMELYQESIDRREAEAPGDDACKEP